MNGDIIAIRSLRRADGAKSYYSAVKSSSAEAVECPLDEALNELLAATMPLSTEDTIDGETLGALTVCQVGDLLRQFTAVNNETQRVYSEIDGQARAGRRLRRTLYFELDDAVDPIPWEALRLESAGFVSLNGTPVIRQVQVGGEAVAHEFFHPVKFLAVLSATPDQQGRPTTAFDEWRTIYAKLDEARTGLRAAWALDANEEPIHLVVLTNEEHVFRNVQAEDRAWIEVGTIRSEASLRAIRDRFAPHIVHVFCHGSASPGEKARLILGDVAANRKGPGNIELVPGFFDGAGESTWFVTLNACSSAASTVMSNFARLIVKKGIPAALGMREPIDVTQAKAVSSHLYGQLFDALANLNRDADPVEVDFGPAMPQLLRVLHEVTHKDHLDHERCWHWSIPRLYIREAGLKLVRRGARSKAAAISLALIRELEQSLNTFETILQTAPPDQDTAPLECSKKLIQDRIASERLHFRASAQATIERCLTEDDARLITIDRAPIQLAANAYIGNGTAASGEIADPGVFIAENRPPDYRPKAQLAGRDTHDLNDWTRPDVGWGLIVAQGVPVPRPLNRLMEVRGGRVFRYRPERVAQGRQFLYDPEYDASPALVNADIGMEEGCIPRFLLIYGSPEQVPWALQYQLNMNRAVGRLDLIGEALENYVDHAINEWRDSQADPACSVVWATRHSSSDFTASSLSAIAEPLAGALPGAPNTLFRDDATAENLQQQLGDVMPSLVVTASHGSTSPLDESERLRAFLGLPIDQSYSVLDPDQLLAAWSPDGAIWYAHACCSAGSDRISAFAGLFDSTSSLGAVLQAVASIGATVAPLPTRLLSAPRPLRAFIGHVEPTFDWTLRDPDNRATVSRPYVESLAENAFQSRMPIGAALADLYAQVNARFSAYDLALQSQRPDANATITDILVARDIQRTVLLGDPAVALPR